MLELSESESECVRPKVPCVWELLGNPAVSPTDSIPTDFCSKKLCGLIFLALETWALGPGMGLGLLTPEISLLFFIQHKFVGPIHLHLWVSTPPTSLDGCGFFGSIVVVFPFNSISDGSERWFL